jgi:hypothetical protein
VDDYCPPAAYLGSHGLCQKLALRLSRRHSASETDFENNAGIRGFFDPSSRGVRNSLLP